MTEDPTAARWERILTGASIQGLAGEALWHQIRQDTIFTCRELVRSVAARYTGEARAGLDDALEALVALEAASDRSP